MARNSKDIRADVIDTGRVDPQAVSNAGKLMREELRAHKRAEIRQGQHVTQQKVADRMGVRQPRVSAIEHGSLSSTELGTLEAYVGPRGPCPGGRGLR